MIDLATQTIEKCKKQDARAQKQFYNVYYRMVYNSCFRILSNQLDAEDCMQESFMKAFDKIETIGDAPPEAWLRRIAINTAIDKLKKQKIDLEELHDEVYVYIDEPNEEENVEWRVEQIKKAIGKLPDNYRLILNLCLFEGYDYEEIAEILNSKEPTVRSQFSRARHKLVEIIKEEQLVCV